MFDNFFTLRTHSYILRNKAFWRKNYCIEHIKIRRTGIIFDKNSCMSQFLNIAFELKKVTFCHRLTLYPGTILKSKHTVIRTQFSFSGSSKLIRVIQPIAGTHLIPH